MSQIRSTLTCRSTRESACRLARWLRCDRGQGLAEFALALPMVLFLIFGTIELANAFDRELGIGSLSREGANIAARGTGLNEVLATVVATGAPLHLEDRGGVIVSRVVVDDSRPVVKAQVASRGFESKSLLVTSDSTAAWIADAGFADGSTHYVVEVYLAYEPVTPVWGMFDRVVPQTLYERAVF